MKNFPVVLILGLLAVAQTTPVTPVTQIPTKAEDEVLREAVTDGFLIDHFFPRSLTTDSPKRNATALPSQQPSSDPKEDATDAPGEETTTPVFVLHGGDHHATTTHNVVSSTEPTFPSSDSSPTERPQSSFTSSSVPNDAQSNAATTDHIPVSQATDAAVSSFDFLGTLSSDSGSGHEEEPSEETTASSSAASVSNTDTSAAPSTDTTALQSRLFVEVEGSGSGSGTIADTSTAPSTPTTALIQSGQFGDDKGSGSGSESRLMAETSTTPSTSTTILMPPKAPRVLTKSAPSESPEVDSPVEETIIQNRSFENQSTEGDHKPQKVEKKVNDPSPRGKEKSTPGWIIILAFIVGVAALVMLLAAIATRDKWNKPTQRVSQPETKAGSSDQQREVEMETFLHKDEPAENGKSAEYTVIPLDELPEDYSSH
ncbi:mucin-5AC [Scophthalmus maximus]|uniref:mucin-5AC n=1 Tax=Scophthalmus maximus TaxID=52904 RepID=UPI001FA93683|nr:mucin-5AC [Scophthalmus maximus]